MPMATQLVGRREPGQNLRSTNFFLGRFPHTRQPPDPKPPTRTNLLTYELKSIFLKKGKNLPKPVTKLINYQTSISEYFTHKKAFHLDNATFLNPRNVYFKGLCLLLKSGAELELARARDEVKPRLGCLELNLKSTLISAPKLQSDTQAQTQNRRGSRF